LAHPFGGLTKHNILHFAHDMAHSIHLTITIQDLVNYNFAWFPNIHQSHEDVFSFWHDLLGLLPFDHEQ
jgi:hypothetical protein